MILGITGYARHGKDSLAKALAREYNFRPYAFADALRTLAQYVNPIVRPDLGQGHDRYADLIADLGYDEAKKSAEFRRYLQDLGTGVRNVLGAGVWVQAVQDQLVRDGFIDDAVGYGLFPVKGWNAVITDVRFPNEAGWVKQFGYLVRVVRPNFDNGVGTQHPSEAHIADLGADFTVLNDGPLGNLAVHAQAMMQYFDAMETYPGAQYRG